jgi:hypothetical protein
MQLYIIHHKIFKQKRNILSIFFALIFHALFLFIFMFTEYEPKNIKKTDNKIYLSFHTKKLEENKNIEIKEENIQPKQKEQLKVKKSLNIEKVTNGVIKKDTKIEKKTQHESIQKQEIIENKNDLKDFLPSGQVISQWRDEGANSNANQSAFLKSDSILDKSHPYVLEFSELLKFNYFQIPHVLRKVFNAADTKIKITKKSDSTWEISSIYCKNPYFRAFFYEEFKNLLLDPSILNSLKKTELNSFLFTMNYIKTKANHDPGIEVKSQVSKNIVSISVVESIHPEEYMMLAVGGINIIGIAEYVTDKSLPDAYQNNPLVIELRKSKAFTHEGVIHN